jgi:hypothetical protein
LSLKSLKFVGPLNQQGLLAHILFLHNRAVGKNISTNVKKILNFHINRFNCAATNNSNSLIPSSPTYRNTAHNCPGDINIVSRVGEPAQHVGVGDAKVGETAP